MTRPESWEKAAKIFSQILPNDHLERRKGLIRHADQALDLVLRSRGGGISTHDLFVPKQLGQGTEQASLCR